MASFIKKLRYKTALVATKIFDKVLPELYHIHQQKHTDALMDDISKSAYIVSPLATLQHIQDYIESDKPGAYMRFGDGDIFLASGKNEMLQKANPALLKEMQEAFALQGESIIKSLQIHSNTYGYEEEMFIGNHLQDDITANELIQKIFPFYVGYKIYSPVALHYAATYYPLKANEFLRILKKKVILFIGNENLQPELLSKLFGESKHIKTPAKNAYNNIDKIEEAAVNELCNVKQFGVVIIAMGCSGRVLMKRLYKKNFNIFLFDFGSLLDGIAGNNSREWLYKVNIDYNTLMSDL